MDTYLDYEAYPSWVNRPSGGLSGYKTFREAAMLVSTDASRNSINRRWDELILDKSTNPFVYVADVKDLIADSLEHGIFKKKEEAVFRIYQSINSGLPFNPDVCVTNGVDGILSCILNYGEFCKAAGQVTWRKNINELQNLQTTRCYNCNEIGHLSNNCKKNAFSKSKGSKFGYQRNYQRTPFDKNKPRKNLRQVVHGESSEETQ